MQISPSDFFIILLDGELLIPNDFDMVMDCWTAEAVQVFLQTANPRSEVVIQKAELIDLEKPIDGGLNE